jgi:acyl-CoA thioester hydrolase
MSSRERPCETRPVEPYTFSVTLRVRFAETDAQGIAHNTAYLVWFEVARVEYLRAYAGGYQALRDRGLEALVLESFCRYVVPARFDDVVHVHARCRNVRGARFRYEYAIVRDDGTLLADGWTAHACVDNDTFRPTRVPAWLAEAISEAERRSASESSSSSPSWSSSSASSSSGSSSSGPTW